jgi:hypothetical protein
MTTQKEQDLHDTKILQKGISLGRKQALADVMKIIDELKNPYPLDIFPKVDENKMERIHDLLIQDMKMPLDRLSAELMRRARNIMKEELKSKLQEQKEWKIG